MDLDDGLAEYQGFEIAKKQTSIFVGKNIFFLQQFRKLPESLANSSLCSFDSGLDCLAGTHVFTAPGIDSLLQKHKQFSQVEVLCCGFGQ